MILKETRSMFTTSLYAFRLRTGIMGLIMIYGKRSVLLKMLVIGLLLHIAHSLSMAQKEGTIIMYEPVRQSVRQEVAIPDILEYKTLKCDFHIHTVYSDGIAWPTTRVEEAWEDGLDAISITDHIEGHPKKFPGQKHQAYEIALPLAKMKNVILIKGGEISRSMPPGHLNALFINDIEAINLPDYMDAIGEAVRQGGFIIWNHPGWRKQQPEVTRWMDAHETIYKKGWMHGIEVFNEKEWYPEAIQWALEKDIAFFANSDIHDIYARKYNTDLYPVRPMTLVFAKERTEESIKEAMFAGRTVALFFNTLAGPAKYVEPLISSSISVKQPFFYDNGFAYFELINNSDIIFTLEKTEQDESALPIKIILPCKSTQVLKVKKEQGKEEKYVFKVSNALTGVEKYPEFHLTLK